MVFNSPSRSFSGGARAYQARQRASGLLNGKAEALLEHVIALAFIGFGHGLPDGSGEGPSPAPFDAVASRCHSYECSLMLSSSRRPPAPGM